MPFNCPLCGMFSSGNRCEAPWCGGQRQEDLQFSCSICETYSPGDHCTNPACTPGAKALTYFCDMAYAFIEQTDVFAMSLIKDSGGTTWLVWSLNTGKTSPHPDLPQRMAEEIAKPAKLSDTPRVKYAKAQWKLLDGIGYKSLILKCITARRYHLVLQRKGEMYFHAEMRVLDLLIEKGWLTAIDPGGQLLIGISKKPCILCSRAISHVGFVLIRRPHLVVYPSWYISTHILPYFTGGIQQQVLLAYLQAGVKHYKLLIQGNYILRGKKLKDFPQQDQFNDSDDDEAYV